MSYTAYTLIPQHYDTSIGWSSSLATYYYESYPESKTMGEFDLHKDSEGN